MRSIVAKRCNRCSKFRATFRPHRSPASLCPACTTLYVREHGPVSGVGHYPKRRGTR